MIKRSILLAMFVPFFLATLSVQSHAKAQSFFEEDGITQGPKIVAWDLHKVLFTEQGANGADCKPIEAMFEIVRELNARGVTQVALSNIESKHFITLCKRYPNYMQYFDLERSLADAHFIFTRKPHKKYFEIFFKKNSDIEPKNIIFFDDKKDNIKGALKCGIVHSYLIYDQKRAVGIVRSALEKQGLL